MSLLNDVTIVSDKPANNSKVEKPSKPARTTTARKPKPYEQLTALNKATADKKAEKKAVKKGKAVASKPGGKLSKASTKVASRKAAVKAAKAGKDTASGVCSFCGKPLSRHSSVTNGMGDVCAQKKALLNGRSLEDHKAELTVFDAPGKDYLKLKDAIAKARSKGTSQYRFLQGIGGDRMLRPAINEHFQVVIYKGVRYVPATSIKNLNTLEKV